MAIQKLKSRVKRGYDHLKTALEIVKTAKFIWALLFAVGAAGAVQYQNNQTVGAALKGMAEKVTELSTAEKTTVSPVRIVRPVKVVKVENGMDKAQVEQICGGMIKDHEKRAH